MNKTSFLKKYVLSVLMTILFITILGYYLKGEKINCKLQCDSTVAADMNINENGIPPYYPFFIKI